MLKIGIRGHDLPGAPFDNVDDMVASMKDVGINYLQFVYKKAFKDFKKDKDFLFDCQKKFKENGIGVGMIGAYFNMIHPNEQKRKDGVEYFKWVMETAQIFDCQLVGSETGSSYGDKWLLTDYNHTEDAFKRVLETIIDLKDFGTSYNARPIIEGAYAHTIYHPDGLKLVIDETGITDVTVDIFNYLYPGNYEDRKAIFDRCLELFKDKIKVFHMKDFNVVDGKLVQCAIGDGIMEYDYYIKKIKENCPDAYLILEGVTGRENIIKSIECIRRNEND